MRIHQCLILTAISLNLSACYEVNHAELIGPHDWFRPAMDKAVILVGAGIDDKDPPQQKSNVELTGPGSCRASILGIVDTENQLLLIQSRQIDPEMKYYLEQIHYGRNRMDSH